MKKRCNRSHDGYKGFASKDLAKHEMVGLMPIVKHKKRIFIEDRVRED